jgi:hydrogenase maturation protease
MTGSGRKVLVIGYGNPGRFDDGLGPAFAEALEQRALAGVTVEADYQLTIEDARTVADHDVVVFVDASLADAEPFTFRRIKPKAASTFTSHVVEPEAVLALAEEVFGARPAAYVLAIRGYAFEEFGETISEPAQANMAAALEFLVRVIDEGSFERATQRSRHIA